MLLTRSPLHVRPRAVSSFDLHVLGTPPAFILSQDQTLRLRGGNRFPLKSDLGFGPRPPPVLRVRARAGFPFARIVCLAFLFFAVQYPVFKVLRRPSRGPVAFGSTRSARRYITRPLPRRQELFSRFSDFFPGASRRRGPRGPAAALPLSRGEGSPSMLPASGPGRKGAFSKSSEKLAQNGPGREGVRREEGASPCRRHAPEGVRAPSGRRCRDRPVLGRDDRPHSLIYSKAGRPMVAPPSELWLTLHGYRKPQLTSCRPCHRRHRP